MNMPAGIFKAKCLSVMNDVQKYHKEIVITKFGKPVAKIVPVEREKKRFLFGYLKGAVSIHGNIISPTRQEWAADV